MTLILSGTDGLSDIDGTAATPAIRGTDANTGMFFPAADTIAFSEGGVEAMRIDSSGNVGIGTSSPGARLEVRNTDGEMARFRTTSGSNQPVITISASDSAATVGFSTGGNSTFPAMTFSNGGSERARIDSSGNLLVGATAQVWDERELVRSDTNTVKLGIYGNATSFTSSIIRAQVETAAGTGWYFFEGRASGGTFQYGIRGNGTVATSDERRKKNIEPARSYLQDICSIPVVKYNWKADEDGSPKELGWLAQDVQKVFPNMVVTHHDGPNDDQEVLLLKKEVFLPMLMKCIQEQQAMIQELTAKVAALEAKG